MKYMRADTAGCTKKSNINDQSFLVTSLVYPFSVGAWPMVIFLRNRSFVSNTEVKYKGHMNVMEAGHTHSRHT